MTSVRRRRKVKNPRERVSRRNRVGPREVALDESMKPHWNRAKSVGQNFARTGLLDKVNADLHGGKIQRSLREWDWRRLQAAREGKLAEFYDSEDEMVQELEAIFAQDRAPVESDLVRDLEAKAQRASEEAATKGPKKKPLTEDEQQYIAALVQKHGDDLQRMFMDIKLNYMQLTVIQLRKLLERSVAQ